MTCVLAPVPAGGTAGTHGLCCIDPVRGGGGMERNRHGIRDQTGFGGCGTLFIFFWPPCFQFKYNDITDIAKKTFFDITKELQFGSNGRWFQVMMMNDDLHFWTQPIFGGQSESIPLSLLCCYIPFLKLHPLKRCLSRGSREKAIIRAWVQMGKTWEIAGHMEIKATAIAAIQVKLIPGLQ